MERRSCDLHTHSNHSDGTYTPSELIAEAERIGLSAVALTDHNTVAGLSEFRAAAKGCAVEAIPGIEISTEYGDRELHILGLFLEEKHYDAITEFLVPLFENKEQSNVELMTALAEAGYDITYEEVASRIPDGQFNRSHVGEVLTEKGYTPSIAEAFRTVLSKEGGFYKQPRRLPVFEIIAFLKSIGATAVLAHPFLSLTEEELRALRKEQKEIEKKQKAALKTKPKYRSLHYIDEDDYDELPTVKQNKPEPTKFSPSDAPEIKD